MQRVLLIVSLAVNMLALFLMALGMLLKLTVILIVGIFVIMLNIFLSVLALVIRPEEDFSHMAHRVTSGTPLARFAAQPVNLPPPRR
ncbi:TPA_asm: ORFX protein [Viola inconspicua waikavirus]|uniref:ORFX protein n=1 Tax=Viola inconspicua waikavirus TaxID=3027355 RepID=A0AA48SG71_9SECO|nr:TPA_asm: ORFX protein [Viola inconspicua waikavirus]